MSNTVLLANSFRCSELAQPDWSYWLFLANDCGWNLQGLNCPIDPGVLQDWTEERRQALIEEFYGDMDAEAVAIVFPNERRNLQESEAEFVQRKQMEMVALRHQDVANWDRRSVYSYALRETDVDIVIVSQADCLAIARALRYRHVSQILPFRSPVSFAFVFGAIGSVIGTIFPPLFDLCFSPLLAQEKRDYAQKRDHGVFNQSQMRFHWEIQFIEFLMQVPSSGLVASLH